jgi:hypothetical protein
VGTSYSSWATRSSPTLTTNPNHNIFLLMDIEVSCCRSKWSHGGRHYGSRVFGSVESRVRIEFCASYFPVPSDAAVPV